MLKDVIVLDGEIINIGPWEYITNADGNVINPLPDGAETVQMEVIEGPDGGLYPVGQEIPESSVQKIARLEAENAALVEQMARVNGDIATFIDFYFEMNPDQA